MPLYSNMHSAQRVLDLSLAILDIHLVSLTNPEKPRRALHIDSRQAVVGALKVFTRSSFPEIAILTGQSQASTVWTQYQSFLDWPHWFRNVWLREVNRYLK